MIEYYTHGKLRWINVRQPTHTDIKKLATECEISPALLTDLVTPVPRNYIMVHDAMIKLALNFPVVKNLNLNHQYEIKCLISQHLFVTIQYEEMEALDTFKRQFEISTGLARHKRNMTGLHLFVSLLSNLYQTTSSKLDYLESKLADIEIGIFKHHEKQMVFEISEISRRIISFRHILFSHKEILEELGTICTHHKHTTFLTPVAEIQKNLESILRHAHTLFDTLSALRETNAAMLTTRQNEIIKNLTIMAFVTFPLTLFSSLFGMNTEKTPIIGHNYDFWIIVLIMIGVACGFFVLFKRKKWL